MLSRHRLFKRCCDMVDVRYVFSQRHLNLMIWSWEKAFPVASQQGQTHWSLNKNQIVMHLQYMYRVAQKLAYFVLYDLTSSNIDRFSNLFHCLNQENICNNTVTKDPTTPQVCRYTTLWKLPWISVLKATVENKTTSVTTHFKGASSSSKADTLNILCKNCRMRQLV